MKRKRRIRQPMKRMHFLSLRVREPVSALTHFLGFLAGAVALLFPLFSDTLTASAWHLTSYLVYVVSLMLLYLASTCYHWLPLPLSQVRLCRKFDHAMIYVFIAGSYVPLCVLGMPPSLGLPLLAFIWFLAVAGVILSFLKTRWRRKLSTLSYVGMGWIAIFVMGSMFQSLSAGGVAWLVGGGVAYTVGALVYVLKAPNPIPRVLGFHEIFHVFVLVGTACHFWAIWRYVMPLQLALN